MAWKIFCALAGNRDRSVDAFSLSRRPSGGAFGFEPATWEAGKT
jgi:hypothetical protein